VFMRKIVLLLSFLATVVLFSSFSIPQKSDGALVKWYTFEQAVALSKTQPRKIFIDVYTDWCGWCKMDKDTFNDPITAGILNAYYYPVKLNAEQKEAILFNDKKFEFKTEYKANELAVSLLQGKMSYPTTVFLDENFQMLTVVPGYLTSKDFNPILNYFGENIYKDETWEEYQKRFAK
jgi:thioredoxin-related protein